jgi:hypothetical protein
MSQQINLLRAPERPGRAFGVAAACIVVAGLVLAAYLQSVMSETTRLRDAAGAQERQLAQTKTQIEAIQKRKDVPGEQPALDAEIAALRPRAEAVNQLVHEVRSGGLGNPQGFARYHQTLAGVSVEGVWVTSVGFSKGGTLVSIQGRALRNESVMQYAQRLNAAFTPYGVRFNSLELTPEALTAPGAAAPSLTTVAFKLS